MKANYRGPRVHIILYRRVGRFFGGGGGGGGGGGV